MGQTLTGKYCMLSHNINRCVFFALCPSDELVLPMRHTASTSWLNFSQFTFNQESVLEQTKLHKTVRHKIMTYTLCIDIIIFPLFYLNRDSPMKSAQGSQQKGVLWICISTIYCSFVTTKAKIFVKSFLWASQSVVQCFLVWQALNTLICSQTGLLEHISCLSGTLNNTFPALFNATLILEEKNVVIDWNPGFSNIMGPDKTTQHIGDLFKGI